MKKEQKAKSKLKAAIIRSGTNYLENRISQILYQTCQKDQRFKAVLEVDLWSKLKIKLPKTDPYYKIEAAKHWPEVIKYLYNNFSFSLNSQVKLSSEKINLELWKTWLKKEQPEVIIALNYLAKDIFIQLRQELSIPFLLCSTLSRFYLDYNWIGEESDLWSVFLEENRQQLITEKIEPKKITVSGPITDKKDQLIFEKLAARKKINWKNHGLYLGLVADGLAFNRIDEFIDRISAFADLQLNLVIITSDQETYDRLSEKVQSFMITLIIEKFSEKNHLFFSALDLLIAIQDKIYLPEIFNQRLPAIIIYPKQRNTVRDGEINLLANKGLIAQALNLRDTLWQTKILLKDKNQLNKIKKALNSLNSANSAEKLLKSIYSHF